MNVARSAGRSNRATWLLAAILLLGSAYFYQDPEWNGNSRLVLVRAVVEQGRLEIDDYHEAPHWATGDKAFFNGHFYSDKAIGASLLAVPIYFVLYHVSTSLGAALGSHFIKHVLTTVVMGGAFVLCGLAMYSIALRITGQAWRSALCTLVLAFGTMLWPYSAVFYGHLPAAAFLTLTFALLLDASASGRSDSSPNWFWIGISVSMAFISDYTSALVIVGLAVYAVFTLRNLDMRGRIRAAWTAVPGILLPLLILVAYNMAIYGKPLAFGYAYEVEERFQEIMGTGIMGIRMPTLGASYHISFDPRFGLFWLSPVLILAPIGYVVAFKDRRFRAEALLSMFAFAVMFAMNAASFLWYGGSAFGPRLLISALPFLVVPLALLPNAWTLPIAILGLVSAGNMLIPLLGQIQYTRLEFKPDRGGFFIAGAPFRDFSLLYQYGLPQVRRLAESGKSPWTLGTAMGLTLSLSILLLILAESALVIAFRRRAQRALQSS